MFSVISQQHLTHATCLLLLYYVCPNDLLANVVAQFISMWLPTWVRSRQAQSQM